MSGKLRSKLGGWLKAVGLAALFAAAMGGLAYGVGSILWKDHPQLNVYRLMAGLCVWFPSFLLALPRCCATTRAWWNRMTWTRRVLLWAFQGVMIVFVVSQLWVEARSARGKVGAYGGAVYVALWIRPAPLDSVYVGDFHGLRMRWMPRLSMNFMTRYWSCGLSLPLWLVGVGVLWPWWKPGVAWMLGGRVRGHAPLRSWHYRAALLAFLGCSVLYWLSYQYLEIKYGHPRWVQLVPGRLQWCHDTQPGNRSYPVEWRLGGKGPAALILAFYSSPGPSVWQVEIPLWPAPVGCLGWLILAVRPRHRFRRRWENGLCLQCGYDLRGLKERCTECGQPIEPERLAMLAWDGEQPETETPGGENELETPGGGGR